MAARFKVKGLEVRPGSAVDGANLAPPTDLKGLELQDFEFRYLAFVI